MCEYLAYMYICVYYMWSWLLQGSGEGVRASETGVPDGCNLSCRCWEWNPSSLQEQPGSPTAESSLQLHSPAFWFLVVFVYLRQGPGTHSVSTKLASWVLGLKSSTTMPGPIFLKHKCWLWTQASLLVQQAPYRPKQLSSPFWLLFITFRLNSMSVVGPILTHLKCTYADKDLNKSGYGCDILSTFTVWNESENCFWLPHTVRKTSPPPSSQ